MDIYAPFISSRGSTSEVWRPPVKSDRSINAPMLDIRIIKIKAQPREPENRDSCNIRYDPNRIQWNRDWLNPSDIKTVRWLHRCSVVSSEKFELLIMSDDWFPCSKFPGPSSQPPSIYYVFHFISFHFTLLYFISYFIVDLCPFIYTFCIRVCIIVSFLSYLGYTYISDRELQELMTFTAESCVSRLLFTIFDTSE